MEEQEQGSSKQERRELAKEQRTEERAAAERSGMVAKLVVGLLVVGLFAGGGWRVWKEVTKPVPTVLGESVADLGREHVPDGTIVEYNSNPPTSGKHYGDWTRAGVYDKPVSDGHLVHSLEHGYVIISYNCTKLNSNVKSQNSKLQLKTQKLNFNAYAHEEELIPQASPSAVGSTESASGQTQSAESTESADLGEAWQSQECKDLVSKLTTVYEKKGKRKLIVIPRPSLDTKIALTAWNRIDKFNPSASSGLSEAEQQRIENFIDALRDKGPEKTME